MRPYTPRGESALLNRYSPACNTRRSIRRASRKSHRLRTTPAPASRSAIGGSAPRNIDEDLALKTLVRPQAPERQAARQQRQECQRAQGLHSESR